MGSIAAVSRRSRGGAGRADDSRTRAASTSSRLTATSASAVTAVIPGALLGLVLSAFSPVPVAVVAVISSAVGSALFGATLLDQERRWRRSARSEPTRFPPDGTPAARAVEVAGPTSPTTLPVPAVV